MSPSDLLKLSGIAIVVIGLAFRLRPTLVVVTAAIVTGVVSGLPLFTHAGKTGIVDMLGKGFADNRLMTLFILTLPAIGMAERYGLQEQSAVWIRRIHAATAGRLSALYQLFRVIVGALGLRLGGHASFVRPLILPMAIGAAEAQGGKVSERSIEEIKAAAAASENYGNFYGQNLAPVQAGILLVYGVMQGLGYSVSLWDLVMYTVPVVAASLVLGFIQFSLLDRGIRRGSKVTQ
ncbi:MAG TPA: DUF969 domain-containing protein [Terriglobia bacterium]|nr:DUF969 domain-containing protein [Terriglobia bacterium]